MEGLLRPRLLASILRLSASVGLGWGLIIFIFYKFPGDAVDFDIILSFGGWSLI